MQRSARSSIGLTFDNCARENPNYLMDVSACHDQGVTQRKGCSGFRLRWNIGVAAVESAVFKRFGNLHCNKVICKHYHVALQPVSESPFSCRFVTLSGSSSAHCQAPIVLCFSSNFPVAPVQLHAEVHVLIQRRPHESRGRGQVAELSWNRSRCRYTPSCILVCRRDPQDRLALARPPIIWQAIRQWPS